MSHLQQIAQRHRPDRWTDLIFVVGAVLLTGLSIGGLTSSHPRDAAAASRAHHARAWTLVVVESNLEVVR